MKVVRRIVKLKSIVNLIKKYHMFKTINRDQVCFLPTSMRDAINENDEVFTLIKVVEKLVTKELEAKYDSRSCFAVS